MCWSQETGQQATDQQATDQQATDQQATDVSIVCKDCHPALTQEPQGDGWEHMWFELDEFLARLSNNLLTKHDATYQ